MYGNWFLINNKTWEENILSFSLPSGFILFQLRKVATQRRFFQFKTRSRKESSLELMSMTAKTVDQFFFIYFLSIICLVSLSYFGSLVLCSIFNSFACERTRQPFQQGTQQTQWPSAEVSLLLAQDNQSGCPLQIIVCQSDRPRVGECKAGNDALRV